MLKGTVLISPDDKQNYFAFFVKLQITDNRPTKKDDSIADERLLLIYKTPNHDFRLTSPAKFIDVHPPAAFAKTITSPNPVSNDEVIQWSFTNITTHQFEATKQHVENDTSQRRQYLESAFSRVIMDLQSEMQQLQAKGLLGDTKVQEKIISRQYRINEMIGKKKQRLNNLNLMAQLSLKAPKVLGCAYVLPLTQVEYKSHFGMSRDDEAEAIAMKAAIDFETNSGWNPVDVSKNHEGYDIRSISPEGIKRNIEVKGRSGSDGSIMLSKNEMNRLTQLGDVAWLYIVINCKSVPYHFRIKNPANQLKFERKSKGK